MRILFPCIVSLLLTLPILTNAQQKYDVIIKLNGDEMTGNIKEINDTEVKFVYKDETAVYVVKKSDIFKINFASGRSEVINQPGTSNNSRENNGLTIVKSSPGERRNKIAVLPFVYMMENQPVAEELSYQAQQDTYNYLAKHAKMYQVIDPRTVNVALSKAGLTREKLMSTSMQDLCELLGAEYVIDGTISQRKGNTSSYSSGNYNSKSDDKDKNKKSSGYTSTTVKQTIETVVTINAYNDKNENIYNKSHQEFMGNTNGSYSNPLEFLLKRTPFYSKN